MKKRFWKSDWFAGLIISLAFLFAAGSDFLQSLERNAYDLGVQASTRDPGDKIAVIAIDDQSIANIGRWPWSREVHANMIQKLSAGQAKVIGNTVYFIEPQIDAGLSYINKISTFISTSTIPTVAPEAAKLDAMLKEAQIALNTDEKLAASIKEANNVVLAMPFTIGEPLGNPDKTLPEYVAKNALPNIVDRINADENGLLPIPTISASSPIPAIGEAACAIGHLNANPDVDGAIRTEPLVLAFYDRMYPSLSLQVAAKYLNLAPVDVEVRLGEGVKLGSLSIATDTWLQMNTFFYSGKDGQPAFPVDSFFDVYSGKIPVEKYKGKIVLIGMTATGDGSDNQITPISSSMKPIETLAHSVASILNEDFFIAPSWALWAQLGVWLIIALYLILLLPRLKASTTAFATLGLLIVLLVAHLVLMTQQGMWLQLMMPATLLLVGYGLLTTKHFLMAVRGKAKSDSDSAESNAHTMMLNDGTIEKSMLGRYQVGKELGKGAIGVVYLGRDPKISRVVAIKTLALSQEFEADKLAEVKERFFREVELTGKLNHPNIVTIYDAGEEHDLAYISMEFIKGKDLAPHTKIDNLLPISKVMEIVAKVADALDYAHAQNVVHLDIKPTNIFYEADTGAVKVTDFGIARITNSSRTIAGVMLGTPSYMSPEQLAGKTVDGRSDLFSLGVMLYQMTTGHLPFSGDSMATLMFKIANEPHASASSLNPAIPTCLATIIDHMLEKECEKRYARGLEIAADIRQCAAAQST